MIVCCNGRRIADRVAVADTFWTRFRGLMGKKSLAPGAGLLLLNCPSIHCFFMKMTIDAVYLSAGYDVLGVETLAPWRIGRRFKRAAHVLELPAGEARIRAGDKLTVYEEEP